MNSPSPTVNSFAAGVLLKYISAMSQEIDGVRQAEDIECIHRMRVASRRLRTAFILFKDCFPEKRLNDWNLSIQKIARALTAARDMDVQLDLLKSLENELTENKFRPGIRRIILRSTQKRIINQDKVIQNLNKFCQEQTVEKIQKTCEALLTNPIDSPITPDFQLYALALQSISNGLADFFAYEKYIFNEESITELHQMRIAAKHLRYTAETFLPLYETQFDQVKSFIQIIREAQDILGSIHDCDIWILALPVFFDDEKNRTLKFYGHTRPFNWLIPGIHYLLVNRQNERKDLYGRFLANWAAWKNNAVWDKLQESIQRPFLLASLLHTSTVTEKP